MSQWSGLSATFKAEVKKKGNKPRIGIALSGIAKYYSRSKSFVMDGNTYSDELSSAPSLSLSAKMTGGLSTVNKLNLNILNQDLESDHFAEGGSYPDPENTEVKAYLVYDSGTTAVADSIQFFKGIIDDFPEVDYKSLKIACTSIDKITFKKIGDLVTNDDATSGYQLPENSLGKIKPIIYGDHRFKINFTKDNSQLAANYPFNRENNVVEAVPLGGGRFLISDHEIVDLSASGGDAIWLYDDELGRIVEVNDYSVIQNSASGCIISVTGTEIILEAGTGAIADGVLNGFADLTEDFTTNVQAGDYLVIPLDGNDENPGTYRIQSVTNAHHLLISMPYFSADGNDANIEYTIERYPNFSDWRSPNNATSANWTNVGRIHDLSISNAATATFGVGDTGVKTIIPEFEIFPIEQSRVLAIKAYIKGNWDEDDANFSLVINQRSTRAFSDKTNTTQFQTHANNIIFVYRNRFEINYMKSAGANDGTANIYEVIQKITYSKNISTDKMKIFFGGRGMEYDTWITGRTDHQDEPNAVNTLIENAAGCVESLLRDIVSLDSGYINNASFDLASGGDLSASKLSFSITKRTDSDKLIHDILERVKSIGYFNYDDEFKMIVYKSTDNFTEAGSGTPNDDDKFLSPPTESGNYSDNSRKFDEHPILEDSFWIKKNPANQIVTDFHVDYYETSDGNFARQLTDADSAEDATLYHAEEITGIFSHPYTKDEDTAKIWLDFLIGRLNRKHWACGFDSWFNCIGKEMWDVVNVQHPVIASLLSSYATKKWRVLGIDINTDLGKISIELEEQ